MSELELRQLCLGGEAVKFTKESNEHYYNLRRLEIGNVTVFTTQMISKGIVLALTG